MVITKDENMPISKVIGYMLKVIKTGKDTSNFRKQFNAIKHGDFDCFFDLIKEPQTEFIVQWKEGIVKTENFSQQGGDCDIAMLHKIEPSIIKFGNDCFSHFGDIRDSDIVDLIFCKCAAYEIAMKGQRNKERQNRKISYAKSTLKETIDEVCGYNNVTSYDKEILHAGRRFVNMVKLHKPNNPDFASWQDGIMAFELAWDVCSKHQLKICY